MTNFIKEWWENNDGVTLVTRPRRFGKTLNLSMMENFFSVKYADRADLFENLSIWRDEKYRELQGTYPVIFLSFADMNRVTAAIFSYFDTEKNPSGETEPERIRKYGFAFEGKKVLIGEL